MKKYFILLPFMTLVTNANAQQDPEGMKKWMDYMTPGKMHKMLESFNGQWDGEVTMWMDPAAPPTKSKSTANNTMIMGGRYQETNHKGDFGGMPFEGKSIIGYDNIKKVFISTWVDNMGTGVMVLEGPYDPKTRSITLRGKMVDPMTGAEGKVREVFKIVDDNHQVMEMYNTTPAGKEMKSMEIKYSRI